MLREPKFMSEMVLLYIGRRGPVLVKQFASHCEPSTREYTTNSGSNKDLAKMTSVLEGGGHWPLVVKL